MHRRDHRVFLQFLNIRRTKLRQMLTGKWINCSFYVDIKERIGEEFKVLSLHEYAQQRLQLQHIIIARRHSSGHNVVNAISTSLTMSAGKSP